MLETVFSTRAARLGTLHELTKLGPVPIIADALGYHLPIHDRAPRHRIRLRVLPARRGYTRCGPSFRVSYRANVVFLSFVMSEVSPLR